MPTGFGGRVLHYTTNPPFWIDLVMPGQVWFVSVVYLAYFLSCN
jgi:hypothetical protein